MVLSSSDEEIEVNLKEHMLKERQILEPNPNASSSSSIECGQIQKIMSETKSRGYSSNHFSAGVRSSSSLSSGDERKLRACRNKAK